MYKNAIYGLASGALLTLAGTAQAAVVTITFDEPGIEVNDVIVSQYAGLGVTFSTTANVVKTGAGFSNAFASDGQILHFNFQPANASFDLDAAADFLEFEFRRPDTPQDIELALFLGGNPVHDFGVIGWSGPDWETFVYTGVFGAFDRVAFTASNKFVIDNLTINAVPVPAGLLLLASALPMSGMLRRRG